MQPIVDDIFTHDQLLYSVAVLRCESFHFLLRSDEHDNDVFVYGVDVGKFIDVMHESFWAGVGESYDVAAFGSLPRTIAASCQFDDGRQSDAFCDEVFFCEC